MLNAVGTGIAAASKWLKGVAAGGQPAEQKGPYAELVPPKGQYAGYYHLDINNESGPRDSFGHFNLWGA